ncbi:Rpn family recombination-promoting nuclease/putative transposase [Thiotrichales bacterium 19S9-12]|nr:Rpn family recombination-promoting nuclease/putative transposase [Thiotrichales bacterium 19S9-11]MCF6811816.1 Rpn family recombination-promoting nuclease/putative transposase [Thiotrichales bacterium 19S9-12]
MAKKRKSKLTTTPHDALFKANLSDKKKVEISLKTHLPKSLIQHFDFSTLEPMPTEFIKQNLGKVVTDVLYSVKVKEKDAYIYQLFEHQSTPDCLMPFRMLTYEVQIMQMHLDKGHDKLPIVVPILYYHGKDTPYPYSACIYDIFENVVLAKQYAFKKFELIDLTIMNEKQLEKLNPELLFEYLLKYSRDNLIDHLVQWLSDHPNQSAYFLSASKKLLNQVLLYIESRKNVNQKSIQQLIKIIGKNTDGEFMTYLEKLEAKAIKRGLQQGIEQGIEQGVAQKAEETARSMLADNISVTAVVRHTGLKKSIVLALKKEIGE